MPVMKELGAAWIKEVAEYISSNPQFAGNGFIWSGIARALDNQSVKDDGFTLPTSDFNNEQDCDYE